MKQSPGWLAVGTNSTSCLLMHDTYKDEDFSTPTSITHSSFLDSLSLIAAGTKHMVGVREVEDEEKSQVYIWGELTSEENKKVQVCVPRLLFLLEQKVKEVACGFEHSVLLTQSGRVFSWGRGTHGQLMHGKEVTYLPEPTLISVAEETKEELKFLRAGLKSTFLVLDKGYLASGSNREHELGLDEKGVIYEARLVELGERIIDLRVGAKHLVLKTETRILVSGSNLKRQIGKENKESSKLSALNFEFNHIRASWFNTILFSKRACLLFGSDLLNQLLNSETKAFQGKEFIRIMKMSEETEITDIQTMSETFLMQIAEKDGTRRLLGWGWNDHGNIGIGHSLPVTKLQSLELPFSWSKIVPGGAFYLIRGQ